MTQGQAVYVKDPYSVSEWKEKIQYAMTLPEKRISFPEYELYEITGEYQKLFQEVQNSQIKESNTKRKRSRRKRKETKD